MRPGRRGLQRCHRSSSDPLSGPLFLALFDARCSTGVGSSENQAAPPAAGAWLCRARWNRCSKRCRGKRTACSKFVTVGVWTGCRPGRLACPDRNLRHRSARSLRARGIRFRTVQLVQLQQTLAHPAQGRVCRGAPSRTSFLGGTSREKATHRHQAPRTNRNPDPDSPAFWLPQTARSVRARLTRTHASQARSCRGWAFLGETLSQTQIHTRAYHRPRLASSGHPGPPCAVHDAQEQRSEEHPDRAHRKHAKRSPQRFPWPQILAQGTPGPPTLTTLA